ncbi:Cerato-platanin-domain-containing protein [Epithele typhae]|uniref:Cerato-platanin-domain-containing protein n=1 Tax=Epithele typhae TaxID=378194 RepID=UPI0020081941|nr:Cerato-platanin-domain-containing protein [Epithele typhae]KAH9914501.1 Cerato-platanin-domain-containing protein [Epithele typhae]
MKVSAVAAALLAISAALALPSAPRAGPTTVSVSFDQTYDVNTTSLDTVACSNGPNGLESQGFNTFGQLPGFPNIGGAFAVSGFGSANCGTCWNLTFKGTTISVLAIDTASGGFNIALEAMNALTHNQATFLGRVNASAVQVDTTNCNFTST